MSPKADNRSTGPINGRPPDDFDQYVPFDSSRYPNGASASLYMSMPSSIPPRNRTHVRKHEKKQGQHSRRTKKTGGGVVNSVVSKANSELHDIPEAKTVLAWMNARDSKAKPSIQSKIYNPFKFRRRSKGPRQQLALHQLQLCKYHQPTACSLPYPGDEPVMAITVEPIVPTRSSTKAVSPTLIAVSVDEPILVPDEEAELEKLVESSDYDLDEVIQFGSLCSVTIPDTFLSTGISTADIVADNHVDLDALHDDATIITGNKVYPVNKVDTTIFYDDAPRAQMDGGAGVSVTNLISVLHNVKFFSDKFKSNVRMHGATSKLIITPVAVGYMRVRALVQGGFIDVKCYYSPHFSTTLLSQVSVIEATGHPKHYVSQDMRMFFAPNETVLNQGLQSNTIDLDGVDYNHDYGTCMLTCVHRHKHNRSISVPGVIRSGLCFTQPLIVPSLDKNDPKATVYNSLEKAKSDDPKFAKKVAAQSLKLIYDYMQEKHIELMSCLESLPEEYHTLPFHKYLAKTIPISALNKEAEAMLWHQRLIHCGSHSLKNASTYVDGVPNLAAFKFDDVLKCPTCLKTNLTKRSGKSTLRDTVDRPYQGLFIDFAFSGKVKRDKKGEVIEASRKDVEGMNGETAWILISDAQTRMLHGDTRLSKSSPVKYLESFLQQYSPQCENKWVVLDQGGELYGNPEVQNLFKRYKYEIYPTGADSSSQNGPVERAHRTVSNGIKSCLIGAGLPIAYWPFAFLHVLRIRNALPGAGQGSSPIHLSTGKKDNLKNLRTFGCRVWVRPPGIQAKRFKDKARKGIFLGYVPHTTRNIIWYDVESQRCKIAVHCVFDEGFNDVPAESLCLNAQHLLRISNSSDLTEIEGPVNASSDLEFYIYPFSEKQTTVVNVSPTNEDPTFGFDLKTDELYKRVYIGDAKEKSSASAIYKSKKGFRNNLKGAFLTHINDVPVFSKPDAIAQLKLLKERGVLEFSITFAPERPITGKKLRHAIDDYHHFCPGTTKKVKSKHIEEPIEDIEAVDDGSTRYNVGTIVFKVFGAVEHQGKVSGYDPVNKLYHILYDDDDTEEYYHNEVRDQQKRILPTKRQWRKPKSTKVHHLHSKYAPHESDYLEHVMTLTVENIRSIAALRYNCDITTEDVPVEMIQIAIHTLQSDSITPEEAAIGHFTRRKLKKLSTWNDWKKGEHKQLDQFYDQKMFGDSIDPLTLPRNSVILRPHWNYVVKRSGVRRSRQCCNGSKFAAPLLHAMVSTWSSCVELPIQRMYIGLCAQKGLCMYGGDARDAYAHAPAPETMTHLTIDDAYYEWYKEKTGKSLNRRFVLPVLHSLQGHPESGKMWMKLIDRILIKDLGFKTTTKDRCIYIKKIDGRVILLLRQVDDFCCGCTNEQDAKNIYNLIGTKIQFKSERDKGDIPFEYLGLVKDYNGTDLVQTKKYIEMNCSNYINRFLKSHGWDVASDQPDSSPTTNENADATSSIASTGLSSIDISTASSNLSDDELVALQLKDTNENHDFTSYIKIPKGKVNESNFEQCMKSSKPIAPIPSGSIEQMFRDKGPPEGTAAHQVLETQSKFNYRNVLGELMYVYITCRPDIGYAITTLSKFSSGPSAFHYKLLRGLAKYLRSTITWGIRFNRPTPLNLDILEDSVPYPELLNSKDDFPVDVNRPVLQAFVDAAFGNDLTRRRSTTGLVFTFCGGAIIYRSKTQTLTAGSSTEAEFIAAVTAAKLARYLRCVLKQLEEEQTEPTDIYIDNLSALKIINDNCSPTERTRHMDLRFFSIQDWREAGDIIMKHIPGILNPSDDLTKPLGWVLHARHCRRIMGHYG